MTTGFLLVPFYEPHFPPANLYHLIHDSNVHISNFAISKIVYNRNNTEINTLGLAFSVRLSYQDKATHIYAFIQTIEYITK